MALLMFRTFGVIIVSFIVLIMYVLHRKKNGKFIKRKAVNEEEKIKYQKWEKIINVMAVVGLLILSYSECDLYLFPYILLSHCVSDISHTKTVLYHLISASKPVISSYIYRQK